MNLKLFSSPIFIHYDPSWVDDLNKSSDKYINEIKELNLKNKEDFGMTHHSFSLVEDFNFKNFIDYIFKQSNLFLSDQGYDLKNYNFSLEELWVQEFSKKGGGNHNTHIHSNTHVSGFYFLKCSDKTPFPIFHDPRPCKLMSQLPEKDTSLVTDSSEKIFVKISPGTFIFFNSYLPHEFPVDHGIDPFRFIHFNIQAFPKQLINNNIKRISS